MLAAMQITGDNKTIWSIPHEIASHQDRAYFLAFINANMNRLLAAHVPAESAMKVAAYRSILYYRDQYPKQADETGTGSLEIEVDHTSFPTTEPDVPQEMRDILSLASVDAHLVLGVSLLFRKRYIHLWQDTHGDLYAKLQKALRTTCPRALSLTGAEIRMVTHALGFKYLLRVADSYMNSYPVALSLRLATPPQGAMKYATLLAAFKAMMGLQIFSEEQKRALVRPFADLERLLEEKSTQYGLSTTPVYWGYSKETLSQQATNALSIAPMIKGWVNSLAASSSWKRAESLTRLAELNPSQVEYWENIIKGMTKAAKLSWREAVAELQFNF